MLGSTIKALRLGAKRSLQETAEAVGVKVVTLHSWETTEVYFRVPAPRYLAALLDFVGAPPDVRALVWEEYGAADLAKNGPSPDESAGAA